MATGVKKTVDPTQLTHIMWAAWGVIDIETLGREPRRNYIKTVRAELATRGYKLECGGIQQRPFYRIYLDTAIFGPEAKEAADKWTVTNANVTKGGFSMVCKLFLQKEDPDHAEPDASGSAAAG